MGGCLVIKEGKKYSSALPSKENKDPKNKRQSLIKGKKEASLGENGAFQRKRENSLMIKNEEAEDENDLFKPETASSIIYRRSKNNEYEQSSSENYKKEIVGMKECMLIQTEEDVEHFMKELMEGIIDEEDGLSKITLYNSKIAMEFTIPKASAGPILVPIQNYEFYLSQVS